MWGGRYWGGRYWGARYFGKRGLTVPGYFWGQRYWGNRYWGARYWSHQAYSNPFALTQTANITLAGGPVLSHLPAMRRTQHEEPQWLTPSTRPKCWLTN